MIAIFAFPCNILRGNGIKINLYYLILCLYACFHLLKYPSKKEIDCGMITGGLGVVTGGLREGYGRVYFSSSSSNMHRNPLNISLFISDCKFYTLTGGFIIPRTL